MNWPIMWAYGLESMISELRLDCIQLTITMLIHVNQILIVEE